MKKANQNFFNLIIAIISLYGVYSALNNKIVALGFLPLFFCSNYLLFFIILKTKHNWCSLCITFISFIRMTVLPLMYTEGLKSTISYIDYRFKNLNLVVLILAIENFFIFLGIYFGIRQKKINHNNIEKTQTSGICTTLFAILLIVILIIQPKLIRGISEVASRDRVTDSSEAVFQVVIITTVLLLLYKVEKLKIMQYQKLVLSLLIFSLLIFLSSNMATSNSRNSMIINSIILLLFINKYFKHYLSRIIPFVVIVVFFLFFITTYIRYKLYLDNSRVVSAVIESMFNYSTLNSYFAGPTNIDNGIEMLKSFSGQLGLFQFIIDFISNVPFLNKLVHSMNTTQMFNYSFSHGISYDQIVPLVIQSIAYFGYPFIPILSFFNSYLSMVLFSKSKESNSYIAFYCYSYLSIICSMSTMLNISILAMLFSLRILPVIICGFINKSIKIKLKK